MLYNVSMAISLFTVLTQCRTVLLCCHLAVAPRRRAWRHRFHHRGMGRVQGCTCTQLLYYRVHKLSHYIFIYVIYIYIYYIYYSFATYTRVFTDMIVNLSSSRHNLLRLHFYPYQSTKTSKHHSRNTASATNAEVRLPSNLPDRRMGLLRVTCSTW